LLDLCFPPRNLKFELVRIPAMPVKFRRWRALENLMNHVLTIKTVRRTVLEQSFKSEIIDHAIRLGWIDYKDGYIQPTPMGKILWRYFHGKDN